MLKDKKRLWESGLCSIFPAFTIGIYAPLSIYCVNASEYWYTLRLIWYVPVMTFIVLFVAGFVLTYFTKGGLRSILLGLEMGIGVCLYVQGNFLNLQVGTFNGARIDWESYRGQMVINLLIWIIIISACVLFMIFKPLVVGNILKYAAGVLTAMQAISLVVLLVPVLQNEGFARPTLPALTTEGLYEAGDDNIIVIIIDMLDEKFISYAMEDFPGSLDILDGFEFYDNFSSQYRGTDLSLGTSFVSGRYYHNEKPFHEWIEESANDRLYFDELEENGYSISIYTELPECFPKRVCDILTNYAEMPKRFYNTRTCFALLYKTAGCVYFPDAVKPYIWMDSTSLQGTATTDSGYTLYTDNNTSFRNGLDQNGVTVINGTRQFKLIHLYGTHEPYYMDEWGNEAGENWDWQASTRGCIRIIGKYLDCLKQKGVYDKSTIIITGDHGYHCTKGVLSNPAFLMKRCEKRGAMTVNSSETSLANLPATIADLAGAEDTSEYGLSILDINENTVFDRFLYEGTFNSDGTRETGCFVEYEVPADTNEEFILTDIEYTKDGKKIRHSDYCQTCQQHVEPEIPYMWPVIMHKQTRDYPY